MVPTPSPLLRHPHRAPARRRVRGGFAVSATILGAAALAAAGSAGVAHAQVDPTTTVSMPVTVTVAPAPSSSVPVTTARPVVTTAAPVTTSRPPTTVATTSRQVVTTAAPTTRAAPTTAAPPTSAPAPTSTVALVSTTTINSPLLVAGPNDTRPRGEAGSTETLTPGTKLKVIIGGLLLLALVVLLLTIGYARHTRPDEWEYWDEDEEEVDASDDADTGPPPATKQVVNTGPVVPSLVPAGLAGLSRPRPDETATSPSSVDEPTQAFQPPGTISRPVGLEPTPLPIVTLDDLTKVVGSEGATPASDDGPATVPLDPTPKADPTPKVAATPAGDTGPSAVDEATAASPAD